MKNKKINKKEIQALKGLKIFLESVLLHSTYNHLFFHSIGYSTSLKEWFTYWRIRRDLKKINKILDAINERSKK